MSHSNSKMLINSNARLASLNGKADFSIKEKQYDDMNIFTFDYHRKSSDAESLGTNVSHRKNAIGIAAD